MKTQLPADPTDPAAALRDRIRTRYRELHTEQKTLEAQRDQLDTPPPMSATRPSSTPSLSSATSSPAPPPASPSSKQHRQVTIRVTITDTTPDAVARLLDDPRIIPSEQAEHTPTGTSPASSHSPHDQREYGQSYRRAVL